MEVTAARLERAGGRQHHPDMVTQKQRTSQSRLYLLLKKYIVVKSRKKSARPTQVEFEQWGQSLEKLLAHQSGLVAFKMFSKSEYCEENIEFWLACEDFRKTKTSEKLAIKANNIYEEFIRKDSPKEINLDFYIKERLSQRLQRPSKNCFEEAQKRIFYLMEISTYPRFLQSDFYHVLRAPEGL
ncbi:regulator of G-protein signaling 21-like [Colossoma macropomum]|uniref:regulator of G-protein signaling 21-like n=1 Tax=Colossoma macropomum TaxID=42526 RepID=UPI0018643129|nr:regulator of G-protein signaling 21-like [Colossoma macropomum]